MYEKLPKFYISTSGGKLPTFMTYRLHSAMALIQDNYINISNSNPRSPIFGINIKHKLTYCDHTLYQSHNMFNNKNRIAIVRIKVTRIVTAAGDFMQMPGKATTVEM